MADLGYPVYDADNHLYEKQECFTRHLDKKLEREAISWVEVKGRKKLAVCGKITDYIPNPTFEVVATPGSLVPWHRGINPEGKTIREMFQAGALEPCRPEFKDRDTRLKVMDEQGLQATLIHGTLVNAIEHRMKQRADLLHPVLRERLRAAHRAISDGGRLSQSMDQAGLTTPVALRMLAVGEQGGNIGEMLEQIAAFHDEELARWVDWFTRLFEPILMALIGLVIGVIVILMYMPIFELAGNVQ